MKWMGVVALLFVAGSCVGCRKKADPFPPSGAVAGWDKTGATQTYTADNLWQYLDGGADQYIGAGVISVATSDYRFQEKLEAVVDVYTMKTAEGAEKILDAEPASGQPAQVGDAARLYAQTVVFRKGPSLVRITTFESSPGDALLALARGVEGRL
jgi:hypothetical protein